MSLQATMKIILVFFRSAKAFPALFPPREIIVLCCSKDPPSPAVFAYWKHPIGPPAEHKAPGAQAAQRRSFWGLQPQCLWRSLSPLGLIRGLHKENKGVKEIRENKPVSSSCHQDQTISCMSLSFCNSVYVLISQPHNHMSNSCFEQVWWATHPVQTASACFPSLTCCRLRGTNPQYSGLREKRGRHEGGRTAGNKQSTNTSLAPLQTDMTIQMLAVSRGLLNKPLCYFDNTLWWTSALVYSAMSMLVTD